MVVCINSRCLVAAARARANLRTTCRWGRQGVSWHTLFILYLGGVAQFAFAPKRSEANLDSSVVQDFVVSPSASGAHGRCGPLIEKIQFVLYL